MVNVIPKNEPPLAKASMTYGLTGPMKAHWDELAARTGKNKLPEGGGPDLALEAAVLAAAQKTARNQMQVAIDDLRKELLRGGGGGGGGATSSIVAASIAEGATPIELLATLRPAPLVRTPRSPPADEPPAKSPPWRRPQSAGPTVAASRQQQQQQPPQQPPLSPRPPSALKSPRPASARPPSAARPQSASVRFSKEAPSAAPPPVPSIPDLASISAVTANAPPASPTMTTRPSSAGPASPRSPLSTKPKLSPRPQSAGGSPRSGGSDAGGSTASSGGGGYHQPDTSWRSRVFSPRNAPPPRHIWSAATSSAPYRMAPQLNSSARMSNSPPRRISAEGLSAGRVVEMGLARTTQVMTRRPMSAPGPSRVVGQRPEALNFIVMGNSLSKGMGGMGGAMGAMGATVPSNRPLSASNRPLSARG